MDLTTVTATELTDALRAKVISSRELLDEYLGRIERIDPALNAVCALDVDRARDAADRADQQTANGESVGPLHGLPMTVKDVWETEGLVSACGDPALADHIPDTDAVAVASLKAAGAIIFGKTNVPIQAGDWQTYNAVYGRTNNPWDVTRTPGGSSGGAAAAVSAGLTPIELGSDIGGSLRTPAHYTGVFSLKPSWGVVPTRGHIPPPPGALTESDVNVIGPIGRSIPDLRMVFDVVSGPGPEDAAGWRLTLDAGGPVESVAGLRVATLFDEGRDVLPLAGDVGDCLRGFADRLADAGAEVEAVTMPVSLADGLRSWMELVLPIIGTGSSDEDFAALAELDGIPGDDPTLVAMHSFVSRYRDWARANGRRHHHRQAWARLFEEYDVVLAPTMPTAAILHDTDRPIPERVTTIDGVDVPHVVMVAWCGAIGSVLLPVVNVPTGLTPSGLPVGVQVVGPYLSDLRLLQLAALIERAAGPGFVPPPGIG
jgi:amidase